MKTTILTAWVTGLLLVCLGGCPTALNPSPEALLPAAEGDSATIATEGDSATAADTPAADVPTSSGTPAPTGGGSVGLLYPLRPPSSDSGGGAADSGSSGGSSPSSPVGGPALQSDPVLAAVDFVATQFVTAAKVFGTLGELGSENLVLNPDSTYEWGTCPIVRVAIGDDAIGTLISLDFGAGCSAPSTAGGFIIGEGGGLNYTEGQPPAVFFAYLTIDGHEVLNLLPFPDEGGTNNAIMAGSMTLTGTGLTFDGTCAFAVEGVGGTAGEVVLHFGQDYTQTYGQADFTFTADGNEQPATLTAVTVAPVVHGNFLPDSGTASFTVSAPEGAHTVVVQFTASTPTSRVVYVSVDGGTAFPHTLPP